MRLTELFVVHVPGPLRNPVIHAGLNSEYGTRHQHIVKVGDDKVSIVILKVSRHDSEHQARKTTDGEQHNERKRE